jgi:hypothetical protein
MACYSKQFFYLLNSEIFCPVTPKINLWFRLFRFRSPLTYGISLISFPLGTLDVSVPQVPRVLLCIYSTLPVKTGGLPHSEIVGS